MTGVRKIKLRSYTEVQEDNNVGTEAENYRWICVTEKAEFKPRDGGGALVFNNRMWLLGGWNPNDMEYFPRICNNEVWSSENGRDWTLEKPNTFHNRGRTFNRFSDWAGRHTAGYVVYRDKMWIIGGDANQGFYHNDVWNSSDGKVWNYVNKGKPVPWGPRCLHHTLVFNDRIWVMGGQTMPQFAEADEKFYSDAWSTDDGINWERAGIKGPSWKERGGIGGSIVMNGKIWIAGGSTYATPGREKVTYNDVWASSDCINWELVLEKAPWRGRSYHEVAVFDKKMWVMEGAVDGRNSNDVWYSSDGIIWHELVGTPWAPRHAASVFVYGGALWIVAGNNMVSDVWKLVKS